MSKQENLERVTQRNGAELCALFRTGKIFREDLGENDSQVLNFYLALMSENPEFAATVYKTEYEMAVGAKVPLYTQEDLKKAKKHPTNKRDEPASQPRLWKEAPAKPTGRVYAHDEVISPDRRLEKVNKTINLPYPPGKNSPVGKEDQYLSEFCGKKREELRNRINLPVVRGNDPCVGNDFYKWLVKGVARYDDFGIFKEFLETQKKALLGRPVSEEETEELDLRINYIGEYLKKLQNDRNISVWKKRQEYRKFVNDYKERYF